MGRGIGQRIIPATADVTAGTCSVPQRMVSAGRVESGLAAEGTVLGVSPRHLAALEGHTLQSRRVRPR